MRLLKLLCLGLLISVFTQVKGAHLTVFSKHNFVLKKSSCTGNKISLFLISPDNHKVLLLKRKSKTKGLKVGVPNISAITFVIENYYADFIPNIILQTYSSFQVSSNLKRGPPSI